MFPKNTHPLFVAFALSMLFSLDLYAGSETLLIESAAPSEVAAPKSETEDIIQLFMDPDINGLAPNNVDNQLDKFRSTVVSFDPRIRTKNLEVTYLIVIKLASGDYVGVFFKEDDEPLHHNYTTAAAEANGRLNFLVYYHRRDWEPLINLLSNTPKVEFLYVRTHEDVANDNGWAQFSPEYQSISTGLMNPS